jgi:hypothetical protein
MNLFDNRLILWGIGLEVVLMLISVDEPWGHQGSGGVKNSMI